MARRFSAETVGKKLTPKPAPTAGQFQPGHEKKGGRKPGAKNKMQTVEIPVPKGSVTETLAKYKVNPVNEILGILGHIPGKKSFAWKLEPHQKLSVYLQLEAMQKRESGGKPDPETPDGSTGKPAKAMGTDELLNRVLRGTLEDQKLRRKTVTG